jgi:hypothetical protein
MVGRRRRREVSGELRAQTLALSEAIGHVGRAKDALAAARPSRRGEGVPLAEALAGFEQELARAEGAMPSWRGPDVEEAWAACEEGLARSRDRAQRLRLSARPPEGYEQLYAVLGELMDPLDAFEEALERVRELTG